jgi:hypothetical protein
VEALVNEQPRLAWVVGGMVFAGVFSGACWWAVVLVVRRLVEGHW